VARRRDTTQPPFSSILCGVDGSRGSGQAVRQAIALAHGAAAVSFLAVTYTEGSGLAAVANLAEERAHVALRRAARLAEQAGVAATVEVRIARRASRVLAKEAQDHDLLVLGSRGNSRAQGILIGSVASTAAHTTTKPLLVARRSGDGDAFPQRILLATDGAPGSWGAVRLASRLARARGSKIDIAFIPDRTDARRRQTVSKQLSEIRDAIGVVPAFAAPPGHVAKQIVDAARAAGASLIMLGHGGKRGVKALGSVSERVVHEAPCSVLVVPAER
jgi:nucleotide-binding universal stress UspA family protein